MPGCNVDEIIPAAFEGVFYNNGQACTAAARRLIHRSLYDEFVEKFAARVRKIRVDDGTDENSQIGALVSKQQQRVLSYIESGVREGAVIAAQAKLPEDERLKDGFFVPPTLFSNVRPDMKIARDEIFGPVTCAIPFDEVEEGIAMANDTEYGLVAVVYNFYRFGRDVVPFGGNKARGFGGSARLILSVSSGISRCSGPSPA